MIAEFININIFFQIDINIIIIIVIYHNSRTAIVSNYILR